MFFDLELDDNFKFLLKSQTLSVSSAKLFSIFMIQAKTGLNMGISEPKLELVFVPHSRNGFVPVSHSSHDKLRLNESP